MEDSAWCEAVGGFEFGLHIGLPLDGIIVQLRLSRGVLRHVQEHVLRIDVGKLLRLCGQGHTHECKGHEDVGREELEGG